MVWRVRVQKQETGGTEEGGAREDCVELRNWMGHDDHCL